MNLAYLLDEGAQVEVNDIENANYQNVLLYLSN